MITRDELEEELQSLGESAPWLIYPGTAGDFQPCESCGTVISAVLAMDPRSRAEEVDWWEPGQGRRHTPRRCRALAQMLGAVGKERISVLAYGRCRCGSWRWRQGNTSGDVWTIECQGCGLRQGTWSSPRELELSAGQAS